MGLARVGCDRCEARPAYGSAGLDSSGVARGLSVPPTGKEESFERFDALLDELNLDAGFIVLAHV